MPLVSQSINNLTGGVVQTAMASRDSSQCSEMINAFVSLSLGLGKRPPTNRVAQVDVSPIGYSQAFVHLINRDVGDRWHVVVANNTIKVFDALSGAAQTVNIVGSNADGYLTSTTPLTDFKATTIGDYTFLINKTKTVAKLGTTVATRTPEALIFVRQTDYSTTFKITVNGTTISYTTPDGTAATQRPNIASDAVAAALCTALTGNGTINAAVTVTQLGSTISLVSKGGDFTVAATDGLADNGILAIKGSVQRFDDLPLKANDGFIVQVATDPGNPFTASWWVYSEAGAVVQQGVWRECPKPGENYQLDPATMPHVLINNGGGNFTYQQATWTDRVVGDLTVNPFPSFVGKQIYEVFFHQNRLGVTAGEHVVMSGAGDIFNFFRRSAQKLVDADVVDVQAASARVSVYNHAIYWNGNLNLWSDQDQYEVYGNPYISPTTISLPVISSNPSSQLVKPVVLGKRVFYCWSVNGNTHVYEYSIPIYRQIPESDDLTKPLPKYLQGTAKKMIGSENLGFLAVLTDFDPTKLYIYQFHYRDYTTKDLSAWGTWQLPAGSQIISLDMVDGQITMLVARPDGVFLETMNVGEVATMQSQTSAAFAGTPVTSGAIGVGKPAGTLGDTSWAISPWVAPGVLGADFASNTNGPFSLSDPFTDANNKLLQNHVWGPAAAYTWQKRGANDAWIQANALQADVTKVGGQYTAVYDPGTSDHTVLLTGCKWSEKSDFIGMTVRGNLSDRTCYRVIATPIAATTNLNIQLYKMDAAYSPIQIGAVVLTGITVTTPHTFQLSCSGTTLTVQFDGATVLTVTDATISTGNYSGVDLSGGFDALSITQIDSFTVTASPQPSVPVTIVFSKPIYSAVITFQDPTYNTTPGTAKAYDLTGTLLRTVTFAGNNTPGVNTPVTHTLTGPNISRIVLTPGVSATGTVDWVGFNVTATLGGGIPVFLDRQFRSTDAGVTASFNGGTGQTTWTLPFQTTEPLVVVRYDDATHQGTVIPTTQPTANTIVTVGAVQDWSTALVIIGASFNFSYTLSTIYLRDRAAGTAETKGRTQLRRLWFKHRETTNYTVTITPDAGRAARSYAFSSAQPVEGVFDCPVLCENDRCDITLTSSGPTGLFLSGIDWEGFFHVRSQRQ